ncbi:hypothetical protein HZC34_04270 [Candidatus Saganbacteria bacterium]|nr:hypothetical protein [Candidatus Saganbacteria bacterium]
MTNDKLKMSNCKRLFEPAAKRRGYDIVNREPCLPAGRVYSQVNTIMVRK